MHNEELIVTITKILTVGADAYIVFDYFDAFYQRKVSQLRFYIGVLSYMVLMMISSYISVPNIHSVIAVIMIVSLGLLLYRGAIRSIIISLAIYLLLMLACEAIVYFSVNLLTTVSIVELQETIVNNIPFLVYAKIVQFVLFKSIQQMKRTSQSRLMAKDFLSLISISVISLYTMLFLLVRDSLGRQYVDISNFLISIGLLVANLIIFNLFLKSTKYAKIEMEQSLILQNMESSEKRYEEVVAIQNQIRNMWHDINNHISAVKGMIALNDEEAERYIGELEQKMREYATHTAFGNTVLDTVIYTKTAKARELGIEISSSLDMDKNIKIDPIDLCTIFSNALDNAIEACMEIKEGRKFIYIKAVQRERILFIKIINSSLDRVKKGDGFQTTKKEKKLHGIGLKSIQNAVENYAGNMQTEYKDGIFELSIMLNAK